MPPSQATNPTSLNLDAMVRLATIPPIELLAETRSALLLVDVQNRFIFGASEASPAPTARVMQPIGKLLRTARSRGIPRFYVTVAHPAGADAAPWMRRLNDMGSDVKARARQPLLPWASEIPAEIAPEPGEPHLIKCRFSAFYETALEVLLRGSGVETVVIGGVASYGCIIATYIDACSRGFFPLLCAEAVDGAEPTMHKAAMDFMGPSNLCLDEVLKAWNGDL
jgi:ureidoacrylate peracid hydrolase